MRGAATFDSVTVITTPDLEVKSKLDPQVGIKAGCIQISPHMSSGQYFGYQGLLMVLKKGTDSEVAAPSAAPDAVVEAS